MITEILKENNYDGLIYTSNAFKDDSCYSKSKYFLNLYKQNIVFFTNQNVYSDHNSDYDYELLEKFYISSPITVNDIVSTDIKDVIEVGEQIHNIHRQDKIFDTLGKLGEYTLKTLKTDFEDVYIKENDEELSYFKQATGQMPSFYYTNFS